jgi:hypothetical protein
MGALPLGSALLFASLLLGSCLKGTEKCEGSTVRVCTLLAHECADTTGCKPIAPHCASIYETASEHGCRNPGVVWKDGICRLRCIGATSESACVDEAAGCSWTGEQCIDTCAAATSQDSCTPGLCHWQSCTGVAPASCSSYSAEECPTSLGCDLISHGGV